MIIIKDHHEAYVTREEWDEMQLILANNAPQRDRRNPGSGAAVLQGILRCAKHRGMTSKYKKQVNSTSHYYVCSGDVHIGGSRCGTTRGRPLDSGPSVPLKSPSPALHQDSRRYCQWLTGDNLDRPQVEYPCGMDETVICKREDLYDQVWAEPVRTAAKRYGVSDVTLAKICRKLRLISKTPAIGLPARARS